MGLSFLDTDLTLWSSRMLRLLLGGSQRLDEAMPFSLGTPEYHRGVPALLWSDGGQLGQPT